MFLRLVLKYLSDVKDFFRVHTWKINLGADVVMFPSGQSVLDEICLHKLPDLVIFHCGWSIVRPYMFNERGMLSIELAKSLKFYWQSFGVRKAAVELLKYSEVSGIERDWDIPVSI